MKFLETFLFLSALLLVVSSQDNSSSSNLTLEEAVESISEEIIEDIVTYRISNVGAVEKRSPQTEFLALWLNAMRGFLADDIINFIIERHSEEVLYEFVNCSTTAPADIKGFFYLHYEFSENFELRIYDPNENLIYTSINSHENLFEFNATVAGIYKFHLQNKFSSQIGLTFAVHQFHYDLEVVKKDDLQALEEKLKTSLQTFETLFSESKFIAVHKKNHKGAIVEKYQKIVWSTILETFVILIVSFLQIYFLQKLFENKLLV